MVMGISGPMVLKECCAFEDWSWPRTILSDKLCELIRGIIKGKGKCIIGLKFALFEY